MSDMNGTLFILLAGQAATNAGIAAETASAEAGVLNSTILSNLSTAASDLVDDATTAITNNAAKAGSSDSTTAAQGQAAVSTAQITAGIVNSDSNSIISMLQNNIDATKTFLSSENDTLNNINSTMTQAMGPQTKLTQCIG
ncbi:MAG: hypothetical protein NT065_00865 [Chlamydiae bacterium]|nr:hypothetical protein [Chlamydiota bacterium]